MTSKKDLHKLTVKYFIRQKAREIFGFLIIIASVVFLPYRFSLSVLPVEEGINMFSIWFAGLLVMIFAGFVFFLTLVIIFILFESFKNKVREWIKSNWNRAQKRARKELSNGNKRNNHTTD